MRITILGINFSPEQTGIAPYTTRLAEHLAITHEVNVFTGIPHYPHWKVDAGWRNLGSEDTRLHGYRVRHFRHYVPSRQSAFTRLAYELTWALNTSWSALNTRADLVLAVVPPLLGSVVASAVGQRFDVPVGIIVQDVMSTAAEQSGVTGGRFVSRGVAALERWTLSQAAGVITIHPLLADILESSAELTVRPRVIHNWTHIGTEEPKNARSIRGTWGWGDEAVVLHSGNMGLKQNLHTVLDAASLAQQRGDSTRFVLAGGGNEFATLALRAAAMPNVDVITSVTTEDFPRLLRAADILLVNERPGMENMSLPSKLTSYFTSGRPVLAAVERQSATASFVETARAGRVVPPGDPARLLQEIQRLTEDRTLANQLGENGRRFALEHLTEDAALAQYDAWVQELLAGGRRRAKSSS